MDQTPEPETVENNILREEWRVWSKLLETKGVPPEDQSSIKSEYAFLIDRRNDSESLFTGDSVVVLQIDGALEHYANTPPNLHTEEGEKWIEISIHPGNPYHPMLGMYTEKSINFYFSDGLTIFLSNLGKAYQYVDWSAVLIPDAHEKQHPRYSYLKKYPDSEDTQLLLEEPNPGMDFIEPPHPLTGESLERLDFLKLKLQRGEIIEFLAN